MWKSRVLSVAAKFETFVSARHTPRSRARSVTLTMAQVCSSFGNYNPVLGECICAIGFNGSSCESSFGEGDGEGDGGSPARCH